VTQPEFDACEIKLSYYGKDGGDFVTPKELEILHAMDKPRPALPRVEGRNRTLLFGYDTSYETHHVFLLDGEIHFVVYAPVKVPGTWGIHRCERGDDIDVEAIVPNKRLYPEACDFEFCKSLIEQGNHLSFTTFGVLKAARWRIRRLCSREPLKSAAVKFCCDLIDLREQFVRGGVRCS